jgi:hypothetical protein
MEDPERGTGRTTKMIFDAHYQYMSGKRVFVVFATPELAREWADEHRRLFGLPTDVRYASIYARQYGVSGVVLLDHPIHPNALRNGEVIPQEVYEGIMHWDRVHSD